jgi:hypothetical protein
MSRIVIVIVFYRECNLYLSNRLRNKLPLFGYAILCLFRESVPFLRDA